MICKLVTIYHTVSFGKWWLAVFRVRRHSEIIWSGQSVESCLVCKVKPPGKEFPYTSINVCVMCIIRMFIDYDEAKDDLLRLTSKVCESG